MRAPRGTRRPTVVACRGRRRTRRCMVHCRWCGDMVGDSSVCVCFQPSHHAHCYLQRTKAPQQPPVNQHQNPKRGRIHSHSTNRRNKPNTDHRSWSETTAAKTTRFLQRHLMLNTRRRPRQARAVSPQRLDTFATPSQHDQPTYDNPLPLMEGYGRGDPATTDARTSWRRPPPTPAERATLRRNGL